MEDVDTRSWDLAAGPRSAPAGNKLSWDPFRDCLSDVMIREALAQHASRIHGRVLDLGCGDRRYERLFGNRSRMWLGLDWPAGEAARAGQADLLGSALAVPLADATFHTVVCTQVLEHVPEPLQLLREALRVLKPAGCLVLTAPQYNGLHEEPRDYFRFTCYGLRHLAEAAGFRVLAIEPIGGFVALFAFICVVHFAPLRLRPITGLWQAAAKKLDRVFYRPKDCMGYVLVAQKMHEGP